MKLILIISFILLDAKIQVQKVFSTQYSSQADVKVFVVEYDSQAGWRNNDKKQLMY